MTPKYIDSERRPPKTNHSPMACAHPATVYVLMTICYVLIALTMYMLWNKASSG